MIYLVDTNVLIRISDNEDSQYLIASKTLAKLHSNYITLAVAPQSIYEYWSVATRPAKQNGLALPPSVASANIFEFRHSFRFTPDPPQLYAQWLELVTHHAVSGKESHDARLVAFMNLNAIDRILTFNTEDFKRYESITAIDPTSL